MRVIRLDMTTLTWWREKVVVYYYITIVHKSYVVQKSNSLVIIDKYI